MTKRLTAKTVAGLKWTYLVSAINLVLQIGLTAIMARLLAPDAYGLVAIAYVAIKFGTYFAQLGIAPAIIRQKGLSHADIDTGFVISATAGTCLFCIIWLISPLLGDVFQDQRIPQLARIASITLVTGAVAAIAQALLRRSMRFGALGAIELASFVIGPVATGLSLAYLGFGAASLIWGFAVQSLLLLALSLGFSRHHFSFNIEKDSCRRLFSFGGKHSFISFLEFLTYTIDVVIIGSLLGSRALGLYNRATYLIQIPAQTLNNAISKVALPALSLANTDSDRLSNAYLTTFLMVGMAIFPVCFGMAVAAPEIVATILGSGWSEAGEIMRILAIAVPFHLMLHVHGFLFDVHAGLNVKLIARLAHLGTMVTLYLVLSRFGLMGFAFAFFVTEVVFYHVYAVIILRLSWVSRNKYYSYYRITLTTAIAVAAAIFATTWIMRELGSVAVIILTAQVITGALAVFTLLVVFPAAPLSNDLAYRLEHAFHHDGSASAFSRFLNWYIARLKQRAALRLGTSQLPTPKI